MQIFICDDEPQMLLDIEKKVLECLPGSDIRAFSSGMELLHGLETEPCDILLLDIDMPDITGLEIARHLAAGDKRPLLLFVTSHDELVYDSFQYHPFAFLRKSCFDREIMAALTDCLRELEHREKHFCFRSEGNRTISFPKHDHLCGKHIVRLRIYSYPQRLSDQSGGSQAFGLRERKTF